MFGREAGKLLFEEAETESCFMTDNVL